MGNRRTAATVMAATLALAAGCSGADSSGHDPTATAQTMPTASSTGGDAVIVATYRRMWAAYVEAAKTSDADYPALRVYAADDALKLIVSALITARADGKVILGTLELDPHVTSIAPPGAPETATVEDCADATHWLEYKASGGLWDDKPGGRHAVTATLKLSSGSWKVTSFTAQKAGTC